MNNLIRLTAATLVSVAMSSAAWAGPNIVSGPGALSGNQLTDPPGQTNVCGPCIDNARGSIFGDFTGVVPVAPTGMCPTPGNADCNGGTECQVAFMACLNDK